MAVIEYHVHRDIPVHIWRAIMKDAKSAILGKWTNDHVTLKRASYSSLSPNISSEAIQFGPEFKDDSFNFKITRKKMGACVVGIKVDYLGLITMALINAIAKRARGYMHATFRQEFDRSHAEHVTTILTYSRGLLGWWPGLFTDQPVNRVHHNPL